MTIAHEEQLSRHLLTALPPVHRVLVIAAHPDDEVFGCGGTLARLKADGAEIVTVIITDGAQGGDAANVSLAATRAAESRAAAHVLGLDAPRFWGLPDRGVIYGEPLIERLGTVLRETAAELLLLPSPADWHPDHQALAFAGAEAARRHNGELWLAFYEVTDPLPAANLIHDISAVEPLKRQAMQCFVSQLGEQPYLERISGINRFRAMHLGANVTCAEAFQVVAAAELARGLPQLLEGPLTLRSQQGYAASGDDLPLVSVIVRSMDRATLDEALDSVALQTWPNIEIVLVNAKGEGHRSMTASWGRVPLRFVDYGKPLHRCRAANLGLDAARGEYLMFLDDDDWFDADHVGKLVEALRRQPRFRVAYTGVRCVDERSGPLPTTFLVTFDPIRLLAANYIPIHAILFSRTLMEYGCRIDESLDVYEDWDFWIQLSKFSDFLFIKGTSATYRINRNTGSGVHSSSNKLDTTRLTIFKKWGHMLSDDQIVELMAAVEQNFIKDGHISNLHQTCAEREAQIDQLQTALAERNERIDTLSGTVAKLTITVAEDEATIAELTATATNLATTVAERDAAIDALHRASAGHQQQIATLETQSRDRSHIIESQTATIAELRGSTSWRITGPLRAIGRQWRKMCDVAAIAQHLLERDSLPVLAEKALRVLRREGLKGMRARVRQQHRLRTQAALTIPAIISPIPLAFTIEPTSIARDGRGHYSLTPPPGTYTYVEPQRPADFEGWLANLARPPRFSIVVPTYNTPTGLLDALITSVEKQWYLHWQLVFADDASPSAESRAALESIHHPRIKVVFLEKNQGISGATNAAIAAADPESDFIVFMDHDDEITVDCLYELARCIERNQPDFLYSDEDKITATGDYGEPHFKPDWSPDTMMSTMFTCHVSCIRRTLLDEIGGLRSRFDGCQDWDLVLRVSENTKRISHVPKVLYHWRVIAGSTAADISAKSYILDASRSVREDALRRRGVAGWVEAVTQMPGYFRVVYALRDDPLVSIIIPTRDNAPILRRCIDSIERLTTAGCRYEIIVIDNGSREPASVAYLEELKSLEQLRVIRHDTPFNFSELNNLGVRAARGDLLLFLNDDTEVLQADWLERLGGLAQLNHVGAVGAKLLFPGGTEIQHAGVLNLANGPVHAFLRQPADTPGYFMRNLLEYNWLAVTGACLMIERRKFEAIGGFCETLPVAYNDIDLCMRLVAGGYYNVVCPAVKLIHHESASRGLDAINPAKVARLQREIVHLYERNPTYFQHDPFHNPNLHPNSPHFEVPT
jgi:glycosyltransferase involved in cell wall biosynthesis/LmbE family N-acetylglucosaminyl deacetylase